MVVGVDIRPLIEETPTGIGHATHALIHEMIQDNSIEWYMYYNRGKRYTEPQSIQTLAAFPHVHIIRTRYPNKLLNLGLRSGIITLDRIIKYAAKIEALDWLILPNLGFASVSKETRMMLMVHDLSFMRFPNFFSKKRLWWHKILGPKKLITQADAIMVPSENTRRDLEKIYRIDPSRVHTVPHGRIEKIESATDSRIDPNIPKDFFLALSTIEPRKNFEGLVHAYRESGLRRRGIGLVIIGAKGWRYRKVLKSFKNTPGVIYLGYVDDAQKRMLLSGAKALIYPSFYEGFGLPVIEAFSCGTPVITSDRSSLPDISGGAAYLVRPHMVSDMVHAMRDIAFGEKLREWYREQGIMRSDSFSWNKAASQVLSVLHTQSNRKEYV